MAPSRTLNAGVLMLGVIHHAHAEFEQLSDVAEVYQIKAGSREKLIHDFDEGVYDNVVAISRTSDSAEITGPFDAELISHLPRSVKFICHNGAGYDQIDVGACTERDILVSNTPAAVDAATANTTLFLILGALRCAWIPQTSIREGSWLGSSPFGRDPDGMTLGILGLGGIGTAVAKRASAFGFRLQYHNRNPVPGLSKIFGADEPRYVSFEELLETSDIISIHLPLAPATRGLIGARELEMMKQDAIIVNTARGPIIQEDALVHSLDSGKIWSVGLDVYENEPNVHPGLLKNPRSMLLPHIGTATTDTRKKMEIVVIDNVTSAVTQGTLLTPVPEQRKHTSV